MLRKRKHAKHAKHHIWNVKITKVPLSDLKYIDVWANQSKNVLPNKRYNLHALQVEFIFLYGNKQILGFKLVFRYLQDNEEVMMEMLLASVKA